MWRINHSDPEWTKHFLKLKEVDPKCAIGYAVAQVQKQFFTTQFTP